MEEQVETTEAKGPGNFMAAASRNKGPVKDFVADMINESCYTEEGEEGKAKVRALDVDLLFALAEINGIDLDEQKKRKNRETGETTTARSLREQKGGPNATGRLRMTIANMLRARAKRRHGLYDIDGNEVAAPEEFEVNDTKTENLDGTKIVTKKVAEQADQAS